MAHKSIVGYHSIDITKGYTLLTVDFENVNGGNLSINEAFPYAAGMTAGGSSAAADNIQVMTVDGGYDIYYLSNGKSGKATYPETENKWVKSGAVTVPAADTLIPGAGFWYVSRGAAAGNVHALQVAGQVSNAAKQDYTINKAYTLIGNPYPASIALNGGIVVTGATSGGSSAAADNIQIMTADGGYDIYYLSNGKSGKATYPETENKWVKSGAVTVPTADTISGSAGGWYVSRTAAGTLSFINPIEK